MRSSQINIRKVKKQVDNCIENLKTFQTIYNSIHFSLHFEAFGMLICEGKKYN